MKMVNIMDYKVYIYIVFVLISAFALSAVNFEKFIKKNKILETRILVMILSFISGYLLTNFLIDFLEFSKVFLG